MKSILRAALAALMMWLFVAPASAQDAIKLAYTDPLSGPFARSAMPT
jgi:hypothetical protein